MSLRNLILLALFLVVSVEIAVFANLKSKPKSGAVLEEIVSAPEISNEEVTDLPETLKKIPKILPP